MGTQGEPLVERVGRVLRESGVGESERLMVGFSGGRDSVALVDLLRLAGWKRLVLCHLDHGLREASGAEAERVREWAKQWGVECRVERADLGRGNSGPGGGMERAGREARYGFFSRVSRELGVARLFLGHHANDQVETFLFRLMRGAGLAGLGGMREVFWREVEGLEVWRPLLGVWRWEIDRWLEARGLEYVEDPSNRDSRFVRNRIRHGLLPAMEEAMGRPVLEGLWRTAELLRAEGEWLGEVERAGAGGDGESLRVSALREGSVAWRRRTVWRWLRAQGVSGVGFEEVERVLGLVEREAPAKVNLPGGRYARRRAGVIFLERGVI